jgi:hypothetical protein
MLTSCLSAHAVNKSLRTHAKRFKRLTPLLAVPTALFLNQGEAKAVLTYNIFESAGNVVVQTSGSLNLTGATQGGNISCGFNGLIASSFAAVCSGLDSSAPTYQFRPSNL